MRPAEVNSTIDRVKDDLSALQYLYGKLWLLFQVHAWKAVLAGSAAATLVIVSELIRPPEYTATALVRVGSTSVDEAVLQLRSQSTSVQAVMGRARAISAPNVIRRAVEQQDLAELNYFRDPGESLIDRLALFLGRTDAASLAKDRVEEYDALVDLTALETGQPEARLRQIDVAKRIEDGLSASPAGTSNLVEVSFTAYEPGTAEAIVDAVVTAYFEIETEIAQKQLERGVTLFADRGDALRDNLSTLRRELQDRRRERAVKGLSPESMRSLIAVLTEEVAQMDASIRQDAAGLDTLASADSLTSIGIALNDLGATSLGPLVDAAMARERRLIVSGSTGSDVQSPEHRVLDLAVDEFIAAKSALVEERRAALAELRLSFNHHVAELSRIEGIMAEDAGLEADIRITRELLEQSESRASALLSTSDLLDSQSTIISDATAAFEADQRSKAALFAKLLIATCFVGGLVFVIAVLCDRTYRFSSALEQDTNLPVLRALPKSLGRNSTSDRTIAAFLKRLGIDKRKDRPFCLVLCSVNKSSTSQLGRLGKTFETAVTGHRCLVVDCDTSKTPAHSADHSIGPEQNRLHLHLDRNDPMGFNENVAAVVRAASNTHDALVFVMGATDMLPTDCSELSFVDAVVYVAEWGKTRRMDVRNLPDFSLAQGAGETNARAFALLLSVPRFIRDFEFRFDKRSPA